MSRVWRSPAVIAIALLSLAVVASAADTANIRLKNGSTLRGSFLVGNALGDRFIGALELGGGGGDIVVRTIGRIDNGWQRIHFPVLQRQLLDAKQEAAFVTTRPVVFDRFPKPIRSGSMAVTQFGSIRSAEPFDEWGRRTVTIFTDKGSTPVIQAITEASPDHVIVTSTNFDWKLGLPLKAIPIDVLEKSLRRQIKSDDIAARFALTKFFTQAEYYPLAFDELESMARDFPDKKAAIANVQSELMNYFGVDILRRLAKRERAGQHRLAETYAKFLLEQKISGTVRQDVQDYVQKYEETGRAIERAKLLLADWQAKLTDEKLIERLQPIRAEINEQLDFETLGRLDAFLKAESDNQYDANQHLGLAYTGWLLGPANAEPDLDQALRIWAARQLIMDYLRTDDLSAQIELVKKLVAIENFSADKVLMNMIPQLPPILDSSDIEPGVETRIEAASEGKVSYWVKLPAEYTPHHQYPVVIGLRPNHRTAESVLSAWAGDAKDPDLGHQRGYIVIAPEYVPNGTVDYSFGAAAHKYVLDCLIDARKRFSVDSNRVFLAGHGMGGDAAFDIGISHPDEFAGVIALGGNAVNYIPLTWQNGSYTAWYVVGKGYDSNGNRSDKGDRVFDHMLQHGAKFDFMLVENLGRNGENIFDQMSSLYDWMDQHVRRPPPKQFTVSSLRKTDSRFFWLTAGGLPRDYVLPAPADEGQKVTPMVIEVQIAQPGNIINFVKSPTKNYVLRLSPEIVDLEKRLYVKVAGRVIYNDIPTPDANAVLQELQLRGDRTRLPLVVINP